MWPQVVIGLQPLGKPLLALLRGGIFLGVGPLSKGRLDKALRLAVRLRRIRPREAMRNASAAAGLAKAPGSVAGAVVGQDPVDMPDAVAPEEGQGLPQERDCRFLALIGFHSRVGEPGGVIHSHMDVFPAGTG